MAIDCKKTLVYLGLGGNSANTLFLLKRAFTLIADLYSVGLFEVSRFYYTSPVGNPDQPFFINAVCRFYTSLTIKELFQMTQDIEQSLGKIPKPKHAPRPIDIDILFYGSIFYLDKELEIPHVAWKQRLFVLVPLADLISIITLQTTLGVEQFNIASLIHNLAQETSQLINVLK